MCLALKIHLDEMIFSASFRIPLLTSDISLFTMNRLLKLVLNMLLVITACSNPTVEDDLITALLEPGDFSGETRLMWSPKAASVPLQEVNGSLNGAIYLGGETQNPYGVRLEKSGMSPYFDVLSIDQNRDGAYSAAESYSTIPNEVRNKFWSSFKTSLQVTVQDPESGETVTNPYPINLWYVEDPREENPDLNLRFTRGGWLQGRVVLDGVEAHIRVSESKLDGFFSMDDEWTLALPDSMHNLYRFEQARPAKRHAWLGEKAFRLVSVNPTGRSVVLESIDPGVSRAKEALDDDQTRVDRMAPHSGEHVAFSHDFAQAEAQAKQEAKSLFIDFETVWCGPCKTMEEWVYSADSVVDASKGVIAVKVDGDDFPEIVDRFQVVGYPTMILMDPDGSVAGKLVGYQGVEAMTDFLSQDS